MRVPHVLLPTAALTLCLMTFSSLLLAQEATPPVGRVLGTACTVSVELPPPAPLGPPPGAAGPSPGAGGPPPFSMPAADFATATRLVQLRDDVHALVNATNNAMPDIPLYGGNVAIVLSDEGVLLVDSRTEGMHDDLVAKVRSLTDAPIKYVVLTHNHADHASGAARLQALGATVITSVAERTRMANTGASVLPQLAYEGHAQVLLGGKRVELYEFCGHTSGDTVVYLPEARVLISGDLVATPDSIPQITNYADGGSWTDMARALDTLAQFDFDLLIAGHGPVLTKEQFLAHRDKIAAIRARAEELVKAGASAPEITQALASEFNWGGPGPAAGNVPGMIAEFE